VKRNRPFVSIKILVSCVSIVLFVTYNSCDFSALGKTHFVVGACSKDFQEKESSAQAQQRHPHTTVCRAFFSPADNLQAILIDLINHEQQGIQIAIFMFTNGAIADALIAAKKRGVTVEIIIDGSTEHDKFSKIGCLKKAKIPIFVYKPQGKMQLINDIMHNKFVIFHKNKEDNALLWTGSFNFTRSANDRNQENVIVCDNPELIDAYKKQFEQLKRSIVSS
jgi:phosphatidylserine/phosphatidylglycerophosphate/cardiolipin synthase-like enzyme